MALGSKIKVGVIRGGSSLWHVHSVKTGGHVLKKLPDCYSAVDIFVDKNGVWHIQGVAQPAVKALKKVDVIFNALHGKQEEIADLEHLLNTFKTPYTGSNKLASLLANHKGYAKDFLKTSGIKTPSHKIFKKEAARKENLTELWKSIANPSIIKPAGVIFDGGVSVVRNFMELEPALEKAFGASDKVLIEEYIKGRTAACGVLDSFRGEKTYALLPIEFVAPAGGQNVEAVNPGRFSALEKYHMQETARRVHELFGLRHYSFSSFIVSSNRGIYFTGVDGLPYLGADSPYAEAFGAVGLTFGGFLEHVIALALEGK